MTSANRVAAWWLSAAVTLPDKRGAESFNCYSPAKGDALPAGFGRSAARPIRIIREQVEDLVRRIVDGMEREGRGREDDVVGVREGILLEEFTGVTVDRMPKTLMVVITSGRGSASPFVSGGGFGRVTGGPYKGAPIIIIEIDGRNIWRTFGNYEIVGRYLRSVLMHEITHAMDRLRHGEPTVSRGGHIPTTDEVDLHAYYNDPPEVRAYMRQIYEEIRHLVLGSMGKEQIRLKWGLGGAVQKFLRGNHTWQQLSPHLTRQNQKRLLKGLVTAFEDDLPNVPLSPHGGGVLRRQANVPQKYDHIDFRPPQAVADAAARGLELRQKASPSNKGGLTPAEAGKAGIGSGVQRAVNLKSRDTLSPDTVRQMSRFFSRHEKNKAVGAENKGEPWNDKGYVAWLLWGGDPGQRWAEKVVAQMDAADQKSRQARVADAWLQAKVAGVFQAPPGLLAAYEAWALPLYAGFVLARVQERINAQRNDPTAAALAEVARIRSRFMSDVDALSKRGDTVQWAIPWPKADNTVGTYNVAVRYWGQGIMGEPRYLLDDGHGKVTFRSQYSKAPMGRDDVEYRIGGRYSFLDRADATIRKLSQTAKAPGQGDQSLVELLLIAREARKYTETPVTVRTVKSTRLPINSRTLAGWRYADRLPDPATLDERLAAAGMSSIEVKLNFAPHATRGGAWKAIDKVLEVDVPVYNAQGGVGGVGGLYPHSVAGFREGIANLREIARHEMQHVGQYVIKAALGLAEVGGLPSRDIRDLRHDPLGNRSELRSRGQQEHAERDIEFYTRLQDEINDFVHVSRKIPVADRGRVIGVWTGATQGVIRKSEFGIPITTTEFFRALRTVQPGKWHKAVGEFMEGVRERGIKVAARLTQRVFYRGQVRDLPLRLNHDKVLWLALDPEPARTYGDPWYDRTDEGVLFKITLKPTAKIIDLMDLSDPVVRAFKEAVSDVRQYTWGPISDDMWASFADFGLIEGYSWARGFLRAKRVDGVLLRDSNAGLDHASVALFNLSAVASVEKETFSRAQRVASTWLAAKARYQKKKEVPKADGTGTTTVYVYSEKQVQHRHREKAKRYEGLSKKIDKLRHQVESDITSDDPKARLTALAVGLIDATFERVGNDTSAEDGHYGVTGWLKKHVTFGKGKATIRYVGKSGVEHTKVVDDAKLVKALRDCCADKAPGDALLSFGKDDAEGLVRVTSRDVNAYLEPFDVTAKDLRGFHANRQMQDQLRAVRKKGPKLPDDRKEREKLLKAEFKEALEATAETVGHEAATLRTQYLVPGLEDAYVKDGTVMDTMKKSSARVAEAHLRRLAEREFDPEGMTVQEIQAVLRGAGLGVGGSRATLVARLGALLEARELFRGKTDEEIADEMTLPRLRGIFRGLHLHVSGSKPDLVRRLRNLASRVVVPSGPRKVSPLSYYVLWKNPFTGRTEALTSAQSKAGAERMRGSIEGRLQNAWVSAGKHLDLGALQVWVGGPAPEVEGDLIRSIYEVARLEDSATGPALGGDTHRLRQLEQAIDQVKRQIRVATKSEGEKEEEEAERLVRPSPKLKPPRDDSRRERVQTEDKDTSGKDKDLSLNYKDVGG